MAARLRGEAPGDRERDVRPIPARPDPGHVPLFKDSMRRLLADYRRMREREAERSKLFTQFLRIRDAYEKLIPERHRENFLANTHPVNWGGPAKRLGRGRPRGHSAEQLWLGVAERYLNDDELAAIAYPGDYKRDRERALGLIRALRHRRNENGPNKTHGTTGATDG